MRFKRIDWRWHFLGPGSYYYLFPSRLISTLVFSVISMMSSFVAATLSGLDASLTYTHRFYFCWSSYIRKCGIFLSFYYQLNKHCCTVKCTTRTQLHRPLRRRRMDVDSYQHFGPHFLSCALHLLFDGRVCCSDKKNKQNNPPGNLIILIIILNEQIN